MTTDPAVIKTIEDLSLNAWPGRQIQFYDGWILRWSAFYTHRTNCVEQIAPSLLTYEEKIPFCEEVYAGWHTPCIFKLTPLSDPLLARMLKERGYHEEHRTRVMTRSLTTNSCPSADELFTPDFSARISDDTDSLWLDSLFDLKGNISARHQRIVPGMYAAIPKDKIAVLIRKGNEAVATGLGIMDRDAVGVYAIHVDSRFRRQGLASRIVKTILREASAQGASSAYLQVADGNAAAHNLYEKEGFSDCYEYYFSVQS